MSIERWTIVSHSEWLERRKRFVTASVVGGLFPGCHPYTSALRLYMEKRGIEFPAHDSPVMRRGRLLEPVVATQVQDDNPQWRIEKCGDFYFDTDRGIAATPDYLIHDDQRGLGVMQIKTAAPSVFNRDWTETDPPFWVVLQALTECMLTGAAFAIVACLVVDPHDLQVHIYFVPRHPGSEKRIVDTVARFWDDVANGREPPPDYNRDADLMALLAPKETTDKTIDLTGDNEVMAGLIERADLMTRIKRDGERCEQIETLIKDRMRDAAIAKVPDFGVTWKTSHFNEYTVAARDKRILRITDRRPKQEDKAA